MNLQFLSLNTLPIAKARSPEVWTTIMIDLLATSLADYIQFLEQECPTSENLGVLENLIKAECLSGVIQLKRERELTEGEGAFQTDSFKTARSFSVDILQKFSFSLRGIKDEALFVPYIDKIEKLGYFGSSCGSSAKALRKIINGVIYYVEYIKFKNLSESRFEEAVTLLLEAQVQTDEADLNDAGIPRDLKLQTSSLWDEINVSLLKPAKQKTLTPSTVTQNDALSHISTIIKTRALKGPPIKVTFALFSLSFTSIFLVAVSNSVRESPYLFRLLWLLAFAINVVTVSIPGRMDRIFHEGSHIKPWHTLFEAATWAFSLWSVIYALEAALTLYVVICGIPPDLFQKIVPYWLAGNWFQALWCFAFRPEFYHQLWLSTACLLAAALCFTAAHYEITQHIKDIHLLPACAMMLFRLPIALHSIWLGSAVLLTFNSWIAVSQCKKVLQILAAFCSAFLAALAGLTLMCHSNDAIIGLTMAWVLDALACRAQENSYVVQELASQDIYESLSITESFLSNVLKVVTFGFAVAPALKLSV
jgi:hypothetical protein